MKILWFTWKDKKNPNAGGAETINEKLAERLVQDGHEVRLVVAGFDGAVKEEKVSGYTIIRLGNRWSVYWKAFRYYRKELRGWADLVIDEVNTIPFFCKFYVTERNILLVYQLCRKIWFHQITFPLSLFGYLVEPLYLRLLSDRTTATESESTKRDLLRFGFKADRVHVFPIGITPPPMESPERAIKFESPTLLCLGSVRSMKRTDHVIRAFEIAKLRLPSLRLIVAGSLSDSFGKKIRSMVKLSKFNDSIQLLGEVSLDQKTALMQQSHLLCVTSVKEGWGLVVTEANALGTPAVVYNIDGLRDSVRDRETGLVCTETTPDNFAQQVVTLLQDVPQYQRLQRQALEWSREFTYEQSYRRFISVINESQHG